MQRDEYGNALSGFRLGEIGATVARFAEVNPTWSRENSANVPFENGYGGRSVFQSHRTTSTITWPPPKRTGPQAEEEA